MLIYSSEIQFPVATINKKPVARVGWQYRLYPKASGRTPVAERQRFPRVTAVQFHTCYVDAAISNATINARYDTIIQRTWVMAALHSKLRPNRCTINTINTTLLTDRHRAIQRFPV